MPTLSSSLVKHQVASMADVEEAMARQVQYGGDLVTNLLELASVSEERLTLLLAETHGLEAAPIGELPRSSEGVRRLVPGELAQRYALYPLEESAGQLLVAVSEPLPGEVESDMGFSLGVTIVQRLAPLVRVRQAIARDYGLALDQQTQRVLSRLSGTTDPNASVPPVPDPGSAGLTGVRPATLAPPQTPQTPVAPKPAVAPETMPESTPEPSPVRTAAEPIQRASVIADLAALARREESPARRARRLGPYTATMAEKDLFDARSRDDVLQAFFDFAAQYFEYSALFAVHGDLAEGREAHGPGASRAKISSIGIPLDLPSALADAREALGHTLLRLSSDGLDGALIKDLERRPGQLVLLLPIRVRSRCVLILYGDHGESDVPLEAVGDVISIVPLVADAVERLIIRRKRQAPEPSAIELPRQRQKHALPSPDERAQALASALDRQGSSRPPAPVPAPAPAAVPATAAVSMKAPRPYVPSPSPSPSPPPPSVPPEALLAAESPAAPAQKNPSQPPSSISEPPPAVRMHHARPAAPELAPEQPEESQPPSSIAEALSRPRLVVSDEAPDDDWEDSSAEASPDSAVVSSDPVLPLVSRDFVGFSSSPTPSPGSAQRLELVAERSYDHDDVQVVTELTDDDIGDAWDAPSDELPPSRIEVYEARPLPPSSNSSEMKLPSVIVDLANDCKVLLEHFLLGDESAGDKLVQIGTAAVTVLVNAFPGPLKPQSLRPGGEPVKASECGPVLRTLLRLGPKALPFLVVRTNDADPKVRRWATHLLGELPASESVHAVARRFFDTDEEVRRGAMGASRLLLAHPEFGPAFVAEFGSIAQDSNKAVGMRLAAIEALAELRHPLCVPELIHVLADSPPDIAEAARAALTVVARQDFALHAASWTEWWRANGGRHRIEWLIDALTHDSQEIRRAAGEELKALTREYFGYYDDLPPRERERAQLRYREWWETRGKARFH